MCNELNKIDPEMNFTIIRRILNPDTMATTYKFENIKFKDIKDIIQSSLEKYKSIQPICILNDIFENMDDIDTIELSVIMSEYSELMSKLMTIITLPICVDSFPNIAFKDLEKFNMTHTLFGSVIRIDNKDYHVVTIKEFPTSPKMTKEAYAKFLILKFLKSCVRAWEAYDLSIHDSSIEDEPCIPEKEEIVNMIIHGICYNDVDAFKPLQGYIGQSTTLGIALNELGLLNPEQKEYIENRAGGWVVNIGEVLLELRGFVENNCDNKMVKSNFCNAIDKYLSVALTTKNIMNMLPKD